VKSLRERVSCLESRFEADSTPRSDRRERVQSSSAADREHVADTAAPSPPQAIAIHDTQWVSVLDPSVARCLIEHGLTPFVPGVAGPIQEAGDALRAESTRCTDEYLRVNKLDSSTPGWSESSEANAARNNKTRAQILERLSAALDALKK
jgi:hypothetical protein